WHDRDGVEKAGQLQSPDRRRLTSARASAGHDQVTDDVPGLPLVAGRGVVPRSLRYGLHPGGKAVGEMAVTVEQIRHGEPPEVREQRADANGDRSIGPGREAARLEDRAGPLIA